MPLTKEEKEIKRFMNKVGISLEKLFPDVGFSLVIFDPFSQDVFSYISNSNYELTRVFKQMEKFTREKESFNPSQPGNA